MLAPCSLLHSLELLTSQIPWSWCQLHLCAKFRVSVVPILLHHCFPTWSSHGLSLTPQFLLSSLIPISSYSPLYAIHSHSSQTHLFIHGVTPWPCHFMSLSLSPSLPVFRNVDTSKSKTSAPLPQKILSYSFFSATVLSQLLWYKILKLVLISFPFLPFMFISVFLHTN